MSEFKEVWCFGSEKDEGRHDVTDAVFSRGGVLVAYTLGQKRRRITCPECQGKGKWKENYWFTRLCSECNGTGKVWEYSE